MSLFVSNLHPDCTEANLYEKFKTIGKILNIHIVRNKNTRTSMGFGYINFLDEKDAEFVLSSMNHISVKGRPIRIMRVIPDIKSFDALGNIFIKNLHQSIDEKTLQSIFSKYGTILSAKVVHNTERSSPGVGFVQFQTEASADAAIEGVNNYLVMGLIVSVCKYVPKSKRQETFTNIYLKPLPLAMDDQQLIELCMKFGKISSARIMRNQDGESRGFGFVCFENSFSALTAVNNLNGTVLDGKKLFVGRAMKKSERQDYVSCQLMEKIK